MLSVQQYDEAAQKVLLAPQRQPEEEIGTSSSGVQDSHKYIKQRFITHIAMNGKLIYGIYSGEHRSSHNWITDALNDQNRSSSRK